MAPVDELFELDTFASGLNPYSTHGMSEWKEGGVRYHQHPGINTGVMLLQPSMKVTADMADDMASGTHDNSPVAEHLGRSDQPWLDAFWLHRSRRLGVAKFVPRPASEGGGLRFAGCAHEFGASWGGAARRRRASSCDARGATGSRSWPRPPWSRKRRRSFAATRGRRKESLAQPSNADEAHCVLPLEYNFFADYKAIRMHVWSEQRERSAENGGGFLPADRNLSDIEWAVKQYVEDYGLLGDRGVKILHWPGELRKPWHRWHKAVRSTWDEAWWSAHDSMCLQSSAACVLHCEP
ncbi:unnamed protein product [Polarella glacialis]|uniref:Uncharacterized protein n=1 Tax=Polarella glacialis TaxID=89957 RepID=A0A813FFD3_POLGL|nr:unnamed protein product [Polarella glacialis]